MKKRSSNEYARLQRAFASKRMTCLAEVSAARVAVETAQEQVVEITNLSEFGRFAQFHADLYQKALADARTTLMESRQKFADAQSRYMRAERQLGASVRRHKAAIRLEQKALQERDRDNLVHQDIQRQLAARQIT